MSKPTDGDVPVRRIDRILATMALGLVVVSIVCFFATIIARASVSDFATGIWPLVVIFPLVALPIAFVLMISLLIRTFVRRARANRAR